MQKRTVTFVALGGLVAAGLVAWLLQRSPSDLVASANGKAPAPTAPQAGGKSPEAKGEMKKGPGGPGGPAPVEVISLVPQRVVEELQAVGTLRSNQSVLLRTEVTGRVEKIGFRDGAAVKQGQLLIGLDAALNEAEVAQAKAELELAKANLKRTADLASKNFVSGSAQDTAESNVQVLARGCNWRRRGWPRCACWRRSMAWWAFVRSAWVTSCAMAPISSTSRTSAG